MTRTENAQVVTSVLTLHHEGYSLRKIVEALSKRKIRISKSGVDKIIKRKLAGTKAKQRDVKRLTNPGKPKVRTPALIRQVKSDMTGMNPLSTRASAKKRKVSQTTIERIIHKDLHGILRKKYKIHALSNRQIQQDQKGRQFSWSTSRVKDTRK